MIFKADNGSGIFELGKDFEDYFRKGIFLYFEWFLPYLVFYVQKFEKLPLFEVKFFFLEIGHIGY